MCRGCDRGGPVQRNHSLGVGSTQGQCSRTLRRETNAGADLPVIATESEEQAVRVVIFPTTRGAVVGEECKERVPLRNELVQLGLRAPLFAVDSEPQRTPARSNPVGS